MNAAKVVAPYTSLLSRPAREVAADLESFAALLAKWNRVQNLVSRETGDIWSRHVADSLQLLPLLRPSDRLIVDLGSGGGFPAVPLAIATKGRCAFTLVEPTVKKASFLRTVSRETGLDLTVENCRAEALPPARRPTADVITSRALAALPLLLQLAAPFAGPATRAIFHKGREHVDELAESSAVWHYDVVNHTSVTDASGVLLEIRNLRLK